MAFYSYKHVAHAWPHDMIERWEAAEGREFDDDYNYSGDGWLVASMWIDELIEASAKRDAEIAQLRADLARVTAERDREANDRQTAGDAWNDMRRQRDAALVERDTARADLAKLNRAIADERAAVAIAHARIAEVTAERDARPEISREDARRYVEWRDGFSPHPANVDRLEPVDDALRAHAAGSGKGGS